MAEWRFWWALGEGLRLCGLSILVRSPSSPPGGHLRYTKCLEENSLWNDRPPAAFLATTLVTLHVPRCHMYKTRWCDPTRRHLLYCNLAPCGRMSPRRVNMRQMRMRRWVPCFQIPSRFSIWRSTRTRCLLSSWTLRSWPTNSRRYNQPLYVFEFLATFVT